jgi:hypothetical protein
MNEIKLWGMIVGLKPEARQRMAELITLLIEMQD